MTSGGTASIFSVAACGEREGAWRPESRMWPESGPWEGCAGSSGTCSRSKTVAAPCKQMDCVMQKSVAAPVQGLQAIL